MRWIDSIFTRKAPMTPITLVPPQELERDPLGEIQTAITMQQSRIDAMQAEAEQLESKLTRIAALEAQLKVRVSEHDASATVQLDALDRERIEIERRREGLVLRIATGNAEMQPWLQEATRLATARDQQRQDQLVKKIGERKDELLADVLAHWSAGCEAAFSLTSLLDRARTGQVLDTEHSNALLRMSSEMGLTLQAAALELTNRPNEFDQFHSLAFRRLTIIPCRRKDSMRAAG